MTTLLSTGERILALVKTIVLARHGKAPKTFPDQRDEARILNDLGVTQAKKLGEKIADLTFDAVVSSPLTRACETLKIATEGKYQIVLFSELTCPTDGVHPIDIMFNELGYATLYDYFAHELGDHLKAWGRTALDAILNHLGNKPDQVVLVGGHAVLQNALGWAFCEALHRDTSVAGDVATEFILETSLGECEGFFLKPCVMLAEGDDGEVICEYIKLD